jgi:hypothetical protein
MNGIKMFGSGQMLYMASFEPRLFPSIRWEMEREGIEDYQLMWALRNKVDEIKTIASLDPTVIEAQRFLENATNEIIPGNAFPPERPWESKEAVYVTSNEKILFVKDKALEFIERLNTLSSPKTKEEAEMMYP